MSKIIVTGYLGKDAELKVLERGRNVINFSVAETKKVKKEGEVLERTQWYSVSVFTNSDKVLEFLKKGIKVLIIGEMDIDILKSEKGGRTYTNVNIVTSEVQILTFADKTEFQTETENAEKQVNNDSLHPENSAQGVPGEDLPF